MKRRDASTSTTSTRGRSRLAPGAAIAAIALGVAMPVVARAESGIVDSQFATIDNPETEAEFGLTKGSVIVAPIPFSNPTIGSGLAIGAGYLFQTDAGSKPSMIGVGGFRSDNGSLGYGLVVNLALNDNKWIVNSLLASADVRYDLYTGIGSLPIRQDGTLARFSLSYGFTPKFSIGGTMRYLNTRVSLNGPGLPPLPAPYARDRGLELINLGVVANWDRRDDTIYPTRGSNLKFEAFGGTDLNTGRLHYQKTYALYDLYAKIGDSGVVAARFAACAASGDTPFFDQCSLGGSDSFRGFSATQFLDLRMASIQLEYRRQFTKRLGGVVFAGAGRVGPNYAKFDIGGSQSAGGFGLRYRVSKKFPVDFSVDASTNSLGEQLLYIYVGQRF